MLMNTSVIIVVLPYNLCQVILQVLIDDNVFVTFSKSINEFFALPYNYTFVEDLKKI